MCLNAWGDQGKLAELLDGKLEAILQKKVERALDGRGNPSSSFLSKGNENGATSRRFPTSMSHFASGLVRVNRKQMFDAYDFGVPMDSNAESQDILMLYDSKHALPSGEALARAAQSGGDIPLTDAQTATSNCDNLNVIFVKNPGGMRQCLAIVGGQYQSYHVQKWMRLVGHGAHGKLDRSAPLRITGR